MAVALRIIRAAEFVCLDPEEHLDLEASKEALRHLALACRKRGLDRAVVDLRKLPVLAKPHFTKTEVAALVDAIRDAGFSEEQRLAVVYRDDVFGGIRDFAFISRMRGLQVQAFADFGAASQWISEGEEITVGNRQKPDTVFIRKRKGDGKEFRPERRAHG
jgi:predicted aconitase